MTADELREQVRWGRAYRREWDAAPDLYVGAGAVGWGRSRRLGVFVQGAYKAYIGVQHVDPSLAGWAVLEDPQARFFASFFANGRVVTLRTFSSVSDALEWLAALASG